MNKEREKKYYSDIPFVDFNESGFLKSYGYQECVGILIHKHLKTSGIGLGEKLGGRLSWVIIAMSLEIIKPVKFSDTFYGRTWHVNRRGPFFRRDFEFYNDKDELMFHGATFSILLDVNTRNIFLDKELPFEVFADTNETTIEASPNFNAKLDFKYLNTRKIRKSMIDVLGHANNNKYGEMAYDSLNNEEIKKINKLKRIDMYFHSELALGDEFKILEYREGSCTYVQFDNKKKNFTIKYTW